MSRTAPAVASRRQEFEPYPYAADRETVARRHDRGSDELREVRWDTRKVDRAYYSQRIGRGPLANPTIEDLARALTLTVNEMQQLDYLQEWHGYYCVDAGEVGGRAAMPLADHIEAETGWRSAWPLPESGTDLADDVQSAIDRQGLANQAAAVSYAIQLQRPGVRIGENGWGDLLRSAEDQLFDLIEYFHRHISQGIDSYAAFHSYSDCGWHFQEFDPAPAQALFRQRINRTLMNYRGGFQINKDGQIEHSADEGLDQLIDAALPTKDPDIAKRVSGAIALYRNRGRTEEDLRLAVRELFDVLEKLRPEMKAEMLSKDEGALFNIANNFTIRHLNEQQKGDYDSAIWHQWVFYVNLSTIHVITRLVNRKAWQQTTRG